MFVHLADMIWIETHKATRSRMPLYTTLAFLLMPLFVTFFMIIYKDPEFAREAGLISQKAQLMAGTADWPTFFKTLDQAIALGGIFLFSLIGSWVFGREFVDGTAKDLLAVPISRWAILLAKFIVVMLWSLTVTLIIYIAGLILGTLVELPQVSIGVLASESAALAVTTMLVVAVMTPIAFFASWGRGYLLPIGITILLVIFANILAVAGWGHYFPWAIPALYAGAGGESDVALGFASYVIVALTCLAGIFGTYFWWQFADQNQ